MAEIRIENLTVGYGDKPIIRDCSLSIADGSLFTLLGPSGCGKTTLLRTIAGFIPVSAGRVWFGDRDVTQLPAHLRDVGLVFQDYALFPDKTVFDNVAYGLRARKRDAGVIDTTVRETLERLGLAGLEIRRPAELSGGQRQRVALARALAIKPTVLLMDEPLSNLDAKLRVQVRETIADLQKEIGITTVLVTHDQEEALALSDCIGLVREGTLAQVGAPQALYGQPNCGYVADFVGAANLMPIQLTTALPATSQAMVNFERQSITVSAAVPVAAGPAVLIARPESLRLHATQSVNSVPVRIVRSQFIGARTLVTVSTTGGVILRVEIPNSESTPQVGSMAFVQFDPRASQVVAS